MYLGQIRIQVLQNPDWCIDLCDKTIFQMSPVRTTKTCRYFSREINKTVRSLAQNDVFIQDYITHSKKLIEKRKF